MADWSNKREIMQRYNATAYGYNELHGEEQKAKYDIALKHLRIAGGFVLDVGCGSGLFFKEIAPRASIVVGVDISLSLLRLAKAEAHTFDNVSVMQADADHMPFVDSFFDQVFAFTVLQNMPKPSETLKELGRVTKRNGKVVVTALKKAMALQAFVDLLQGAGFIITSFTDEEDLKCYVSVLALSN